MLPKGDIARLSKVMQYLQDIERICLRHQTIRAALDDFEGKHALMMCLLQIGEVLHGIHDPAVVAILEIPKVVAFRNMAAHEYEAMLPDRIHAIISDKLPEMKDSILHLLQQEPDYQALCKLWE